MSNKEFDKHDRTLMILATQYQSLAMASLGKMQNPATGKIERDLDQARFFIDVMEMLKVKCRTETSEDILRVIDAAVMDLQLNYLDESKKPAAADGEDDATSEQDMEATKDAAEEEAEDTTEGEANS